MDTKITPLPWVHHPEDNIITDASGRMLVEWQPRSLNVTVSTRDANAAFIVKAVNTHDALLAVLKDAIRPYGVFDVALHACHKDNVKDFLDLLTRTRAAIAAAEGK